MTLRLATVSVLVDDYDRAIDWYGRALGFVLTADQDMGGGKRWVTMAPPGGGAALLLARAADDRQRSLVGGQAGGRVFLFLHTDDFAETQARMLAEGVEFREPPRREPYGTVAVFRDCCGNLWDLIEPAAPTG